LLGIDLGTAQEPQQAFVPLTRLLGVLARIVAAETIDCGASGSRKRGWKVDSLQTMASASALPQLSVHRTVAPSIDDRIGAARETRARLSAIVDQARRILTLGLRARAGDSVTGLEDAAREMLSWSADVNSRIDLQEGLGLSFLPRLWRTGIDLALGHALWRPLVLATHELIGQADRLDGLTKRMAA
jgi:hypothetical protein